MPDDKRFGVFWMEPRALAAAFDMDGAFNDVVLDAAAGRVRADWSSTRSTRLLEPYGGTGAYPRAISSRTGS